MEKCVSVATTVFLKSTRNFPQSLASEWLLAKKSSSRKSKHSEKSFSSLKTSTRVKEMPSVSLMRSEDSMPDIWRMNHNWTVSRASIDRKSLARQRLLRPQRGIDKKASGHTLTWSDYSSEMETFPEGPKRVTDSEENTTWRVHH